MKFLLILAAILSIAVIPTTRTRAASITVTSPKAGDTVSRGHLEIDAIGEGDLVYPITYSYSTNSGASWEGITYVTGAGTPDIAVFHWNDVPSVSSPRQAIIRIRDGKGVTGISGVFTIGPAPKFLGVVVNKGGTPVPTDTDVEVSWTLTGFATTFDVDYRLEGSGRFEIQYELDGSARSAIWHTPKEEHDSVRVRVQTNGGEFIESALFSISNTNSITITSPKAGDVVQSGVDIRATYRGVLVSPITYEYTTDQGATWVKIKEYSCSGDDPGISTYLWLAVPHINSPGQIRIRDGSGVIGLSGVFMFKPSPEVLSLIVNGSVYPVPVNSDVVVAWTAAGEPTSFGLSYSIDHFAQLEIDANIPGSSRNLIWHTPSEPVSNVYVKLSTANGNSIEIGPFDIGDPAIVANADNSDRLLAFPNPASKTLRVDLPRSNSPALLSLSDLTGRVIMKQSMLANSGLATIDVSGIPVGVYFLTVRNGMSTKSSLVTIAR
jgi:hypothetical protein